MKYDHKIIQDFVTYPEGTDVPDIGSWKRQDIKSPYMGLSTDLDKFPEYADTGAIAYCVDNGDVYVYEATTKQLYKQ